MTYNIRHLESRVTLGFSIKRTENRLAEFHSGRGVSKGSALGQTSIG